MNDKCGDQQEMTIAHCTAAKTGDGVNSDDGEWEYEREEGKGQSNGERG